MVNPQYLVNISYRPSHFSGKELQVVSGVTQSVNKYDGGYFIASMPEAKLSATGSSYETSLDNLLLMAASASYPGNPPLGNTRTW